MKYGDTSKIMFLIIDHLNNCLAIIEMYLIKLVICKIEYHRGKSSKLEPKQHF